jgi:hypothetical protein
LVAMKMAMVVAVIKGTRGRQQKGMGGGCLT